MKHIHILIAMLFVGITSTSCSGFLEQNPQTDLSENDFYKTADDITSAVNGVYSTLQEGDIYGNWYVFGEIPSDNTRNQLSGSVTSQNEFDQFYIDTQNSYISSFWSAAYKAINRANTVLGRIDNIEIDPDDFSGKAASRIAELQKTADSIDKRLDELVKLQQELKGRLNNEQSSTIEILSSMVLTGAAGMKPRRPPAYYVKKARFSVLKKFLPREKLEKYYSSDYRVLNAVMRESFLKIVNEHLEESAKRVQNPVLLVYGENDRETPLYMAKRYRRLLPSSRLLVIGGAGHFAFAEKIAAFNYPVREFLLAGKE